MISLLNLDSIREFKRVDGGGIYINDVN
jgi:hypothetical protein